MQLVPNELCVKSLSMIGKMAIPHGVVRRLLRLIAVFPIFADTWFGFIRGVYVCLPKNLFCDSLSVLSGR